MTTLIRAQVFHTPASPFEDPRALESVSDGAVAFGEGRILMVGSYGDVRAAFPEAQLEDARGAVLLPGFVDTHVHYPQLHVIGVSGLTLLAWLSKRTLPEEIRLNDAGYARVIARGFLKSLLQNGTTAALVFGAHFEKAQDIFFEEASRLGMHVASGLVLSDRLLSPELETTPEAAYAASERLLTRWHQWGNLRYAVTPRFSLSCSEGMLEVAGALLQVQPGVLFQTHVNENRDEIRAVKALFPWAEDYLATYERYGLVSARSVFAHDVHVTDSELRRMARAGASVAHCPSSNHALGSGLFPLRRHLEAGVRVALGSDVGAGTGFSLLKEGLEAYQAQMLLQDAGQRLTPAQLLYLATRAGALALGLGNELGDLSPGKRADFVLLRPPKGSTLEALLAQSPSAEATLGALFTLAREESVDSVFLAGVRPSLLEPGA